MDQRLTKFHSINERKTESINFIHGLNSQVSKINKHILCFVKFISFSSSVYSDGLRNIR